MARQSNRISWFPVFGGLSNKKNSSRGVIGRRRLMAESLENRMVLSVAPIDDSADASLADYLAVEHEMGPIVPAEFAASDLDISAEDPSAQPIFAAFTSAFEGEGEAEGGGAGSGGGSGSAQGSGSGQGSASGQGSSGGGSASGSGSGSGGGSSGAGDEESEDPSVSDVSFESTGTGAVTVSGSVSDDGDLSNVTVTILGASGDVTMNANGTFTINITDTNGNTFFEIIVTDADGNTITTPITYPT